MRIRTVYLVVLFAAGLSISMRTSTLFGQSAPASSVRRVLLLSIDGFHAVDLAIFIQSHPASTLAKLSASGITYTQAYTSKPSNSFPGLLSLLTGGSPASTGIWYEGAYARSLSPPGSNCKTTGTEVIWSNVLDRNRKLPDAGGGIDPAKLPLDPSKGCVPVYPHSFLRVNTIFEVARAAGLRTAWIDKHPSYEMVSGPSGAGVDDLYTPEIGSATRDVKGQNAYDDVKVQAIVNEINGRDHAGRESLGVPALFGMAFQAFRFAQVTPSGGYADASGTPSAPLLETIEHIDQSIGKMAGALKARGLLDSTVIIISAKHGQAPIDPSKHRVVDDAIIPNLVNRIQDGLLALSYSDGNLTSIWLTDQSQTGRVATVLSQPANQSAAGIQKVLWGESLKLMTNDPLRDSRIPDIVVVPNVGDIYASAGDTSIAAHGGFSEEDTHVALLISNPLFSPQMIKVPVQTTQVAPTILQTLGLAPDSLQAVREEKTAVLPGMLPAKRLLVAR
jgi:Type I phosphodiesterase / nucleotide pyrophosphatase